MGCVPKLTPLTLPRPPKRYYIRRVSQEVVTHTLTFDMAYTFACSDCSPRDQEFQFWKQRNDAKRVTMALLAVDDADFFHEPEEANDGSRKACFACEEAYVLLSPSEQKTKQLTEAQAWAAYQAIPSTDYWSWLRLNQLAAQPGRPESSSRYNYVDAVLRHRRDPRQLFRTYFYSTPDNKE